MKSQVHSYLTKLRKIKYLRQTVGTTSRSKVSDKRQHTFIAETMSDLHEQNHFNKTKTLISIGNYQTSKLNS